MSEEERYADQEAEIARLTSAFAQVIERLQSEVARLERELRVERAITRHDDEVRALCDELRVVHMPGRMGGEATIGDTRIDCRTIAERVWAGDTVADLADDFGLTRDQVRLACWWLAEHCLPLYVRWEWEAKDAWRAWAKRWETLARNGDGDRAGDPTAREGER